MQKIIMIQFFSGTRKHSIQPLHDPVFFRYQGAQQAFIIRSIIDHIEELVVIPKLKKQLYSFALIINPFSSQAFFMKQIYLNSYAISLYFNVHLIIIHLPYSSAVIIILTEQKYQGTGEDN